MKKTYTKKELVNKLKDVIDDDTLHENTGVKKQ